MKIFRSLLLLTFLPLLAAAATRRVPSDYTDIQSAIDASVSGDTVLVAPKTYRVNLDFTGKNIVLTSEAGPDVTILQQDINDDIVSFTNGEGPGAIVKGFTLLGGTAHACAIRIQNSSPTIDGNYLKYHHSYAGGQPQIYVKDSGSPTIKNNLFVNDDSLRMAIWIWVSDPVYVINNTFYGGDRGIFNWSPQAVIRNNIVVGMGTGISTNNPITEDHNNSWGNTTNYSGLTPSATSLSVDPQFIDTSQSIFLLSPGSPCINAGHTSSAYDDPDGTTSDMGAFYFDMRIPSAYNLGLIGEEIGHALNHTPEFHWSFYGIEQEGYQIEVGTDSDWSSAENWTHSSGLTTDTAVGYGGVPLQDSVTYYYRIRVSDSASIGHWVESVFRMNSPSVTPAAYWPTGGEAVSVKGVQLYVLNPNEPEGDSLFLDYEIYSDPGLTSMVTSVYGVPEQRDSTGSGYFYGLPVGSTYYWRCRTYDKLEYSDWSTETSFVVRAGTIISVPSMYGTIREGINAAQQGDTVLVADGIYSGDGNRDLTFNGVNLVLKSENGPDATSIIVGGSETDLHNGVYLHMGEDSSSVIDGFTIGYGFVNRGAVWINYNNGVTLKNCTITESSSFGLYTGWGGFVRIDGCRFENNVWDGAYLIPEAEVTNSLFLKNGGSGMTIDGWNLTSISNCTFVSNDAYGFLIMGEPPMKSVQSPAEDSNYVFNCVSAYNGECGFGQYFWSRPVAYDCNNTYGNGVENYCCVFPHVGENGNISEHPLFCDTTAEYFQISDESPCAPDNNSCSVLIGAFDIGCTGCCVYRGDINHSGGDTPVDISDITAFVDFLFAGGPAPICPEEGDVNASGQTDITDLTFMVDFIFNGGSPPPPC